MNISQQGLELIKKWEGLRLQAYQDQAGVWTIGYGHTYEVMSDMTITSDAAVLLLWMDVRDAVRAVNINVVYPDKLTQGQFDALVSWTFNLGAGNLVSSHLLVLVNAGKYAEAADEFLLRCHVNHEWNEGLENRRKDEVRMWNGTWQT